MQLIELYQFQIGAAYYRFTSSKKAYTYLSNTFTPLAIGRGSLGASGDIARTSLDVSLDISSDFAQAVLGGENSVSMTLYRSIDGTVSPWFSGNLAGVSHSKNVLTLSFNDILTNAKRTGIRRVCSRLCPLALYGTECSAGATFVGITVGSISGNTVIASGTFADGEFANGILFFGALKAFILSNIGGAFTLKSIPAGLTIGSAASVVKGCDQTPDTCRDRFSNIARFGGFPRVTVDNPFNTVDSL